MWKNKKVLVTGSEGMIGKELVIQLEKLGVEIFKFDIKRNWSKWDIDFGDCNECGSKNKLPMDARDNNLVEEIFSIYKPDYVFHLFGIKGSPKMTQNRPVDFMGPMLQGDTNMILAAQKCGVKQFLYTSSIAVLNPQTDKYPAHAKKTAETLIEAMRIQYPEGTKYCIIRPSNVYGRFDNFDNPDAMVITSLISKSKVSPFDVWGDGSNVRDFINSKDVANAMIKCMEKMPTEPINIGAGYGTSIKNIADLIAKFTNSKVIYNKLKQTGDQTRFMPVNQKIIGFTPQIGIIDGLKEVIKWKK